MSYQYFMQHIQQLAAMGMFNPSYTTIPFMPFPSVQPSLPKPQKGTIVLESESDGEDDYDERSLFCANLNENITEELLYEVFLQAGPLQKVFIPKQNGKNRSYGFVTYKYRCSAPYAIELFQGLVLYGKRLDIKSQGKHNSNNRR